MKKLFRVLLITVTVLFAVVLVTAAIAVVDAFALASGEAYYNLEAGELLSGYVGQPQNPVGAGVLLLHEWWGLTEDIVRMADLLATEGYVVLAPDLYQGRLARTVPGAILLRIITPQSDTLAIASEGYRFLEERVDHGTAVVGFCFGGTQAMELGRRTPSIAATAIFYGSGLISTPEQVDALGASGPVLGIFGSEDASIPISEVERFKAALEAAGVENRVTVYDGVGHAFVDYSELNDGGQAEDAWAEMVSFLERHVKPEDWSR
jgi:carboxymethylenebutenolidase